MKVKELVKECERELKVVRWHSNYIWLLYRFFGEFEEIRKGIRFDDFNNVEINQFIEVCDNRINRAKIFLSEIAMALGFAITALTIIAVLVSGTLENESCSVNLSCSNLSCSVNQSCSDNQSGSIDPINAILTGPYSPPFKSLVIFLFAGVIILFILFGHYRTHVHAWTAFKEEAILNENGKADRKTLSKTRRKHC